MKRVDELVTALALLPHPEGGFYKETYRSKEKTELASVGAQRDLATSIYYLLSGQDFSSLHRIEQDENWYFHEGGTLHVHDIAPNGDYVCHALGLDLTAGETPQCTIKAGHWFGASLKSVDSYALVGCVVAPGFDFEDLEIGVQEDLLDLFPHLDELIRRLTR